MFPSQSDLLLNKKLLIPYAYRMVAVMQKTPFLVSSAVNQCFVDRSCKNILVIRRRRKKNYYSSNILDNPYISDPGEQ